MLPARVLGFNLNQKTWGQFNIDGIIPISATDENIPNRSETSGGRDVYRRELQALVNSHGRLQQQSEDWRSTTALDNFEIGEEDHDEEQLTGLCMLFHGKNTKASISNAK